MRIPIETLNKKINALRFQQIDWLPLCKAAQIGATTEQLITEPAEWSSSLWSKLLGIACARFEKVDSSHLLQEFGRFKEAIETCLSLDEEGRAYFEGDYAVFSHFIALWLGKKDKQSPRIEALWPRLDAEESKKRYDDLISRLLSERGLMLMRSCQGRLLTKEEVLRWDEELCRLRSITHHPVQEGEALPTYALSSVQADSILKAIWGWFTNLLSLFSPQKTPSFLEQLDVLNNIWSMAKRHGFLTTILEVEDNNLRASFAPYHQAQALAFNAIQRIAESGFNPSALLGNPVKGFIADCNQDLEALETWSRALFHSVILTYLENPEVGAQTFLDTFTKVQGEIRAYGETLYACRVKAEQAWRGKGDYLSRLDKFDAALASIEEGLFQLQRELIQEAKESLREDSSFQAACQCFEVLASNEMAVLSRVSWAELTCYSPVRNEDTLNYEMDARHKAYKKKMNNEEGLLGQFGSYRLHSIFGNALNLLMV